MTPIESLLIETLIKTNLGSSLKTVISKKDLEENFYLIPGKYDTHKIKLSFMLEVMVYITVLVCLNLHLTFDLTPHTLLLALLSVHLP